MKKLCLILGSLVLAILVMAGGYILYAMHMATAPGPLTENKILVIGRGTGIAGIAQRLENEGVISSSLAFKINAGLQKSQGSLKAGEYEFTSAISMQAAIDMIRSGKVYDRKITFPEGLTSHQIVDILNKSDMLTGDPVEAPRDGSLLPETYHIVKGDTRQSVLNQMSAAMAKTVDELWAGRAPDLPFTTVQEAVTLASIVEKETGLPSERAKVAGVFINRLKRGIPLQSDPTVIYAMNQGVNEEEGQGPIGRHLLSKDLEMESPYNTYINAGLPPGPIANPGRASIEAVLHPEVHDFIYFVADGTGGHAFARNLAEHNANVAKWRKIRRAQ